MSLKMLGSSRGLGNWTAILNNAQAWRQKAEQIPQPIRHTRPTDLMDEDDRLWCDILSLQEQSVHDKKAHWAKVVQSFERAAWEMRFLIWVSSDYASSFHPSDDPTHSQEKDDEVFQEHGYLQKLHKYEPHIFAMTINLPLSGL